MTQRTLKSTAAYEDGEEFERTFELDIPDDIENDALDEVRSLQAGRSQP